LTGLMIMLHTIDVALGECHFNCSIRLLQVLLGKT
jgi:hypothetical protein